MTDRFMSKVVQFPSGCWIWIGARQTTAAEFGVSKQTISDVKRRRSWAHIGDDHA